MKVVLAAFFLSVPPAAVADPAADNAAPSVAASDRTGGISDGPLSPLASTAAKTSSPAEGMTALGSAMIAAAISSKPGMPSGRMLLRAQSSIARLTDDMRAFLLK